MGIIGYTYRAANYCPGCVEGAYGDNTFSENMFPEDALDALAALAGIDRDDEHSFDSDDFPKVILSLDADAVDVCADCMGEIA